MLWFFRLTKHHSKEETILVEKRVKFTLCIQTCGLAVTFLPGMHGNTQEMWIYTVLERMWCKVEVFSWTRRCNVCKEAELPSNFAVELCLTLNCHILFNHFNLIMFSQIISCELLFLHQGSKYQMWLFAHIQDPYLCTRIFLKFVLTD